MIDVGKFRSGYREKFPAARMAGVAAAVCWTAGNEGLHGHAGRSRSRPRCHPKPQHVRAFRPGRKPSLGSAAARCRCRERGPARIWFAALVRRVPRARRVISTGSRSRGGKRSSAPPERCDRSSNRPSRRSRREIARSRPRSSPPDEVPPQAHKRADRLAKAKFRQSNRPQPVENPPVELLQGVDLLQHGRAMSSQGRRIRLRHVRGPRQRDWRGPATRTDRAQIRHAARGQSPCARHPAVNMALSASRRFSSTASPRVVARWFSLPQIAASSGGPAGLDARVIVAGFNILHRFRERLNWLRARG